MLSRAPLLRGRVILEPCSTTSRVRRGGVGLCGGLSVLARGRATPGRRQIGWVQGVLRGPFCRRLLRRRFSAAAAPRRAVCQRAGLAWRERLAQEIVEHFGARLRLVADGRRYLRADRAGVGLAGAEAAK